MCTVVCLLLGLALSDGAPIACKDKGDAISGPIACLALKRASKACGWMDAVSKGEKGWQSCMKTCGRCPQQVARSAAGLLVPKVACQTTQAAGCVRPFVAQQQIPCQVPQQYVPVGKPVDCAAGLSAGWMKALCAGRISVIKQGSCNVVPTVCSCCPCVPPPIPCCITCTHTYRLLSKRNATQRNAAQRSATQCNATKPSQAKPSPAQPSPAQPSPAQPSRDLHKQTLGNPSSEPYYARSLIRPEVQHTHARTRTRTYISQRRNTLSCYGLDSCSPMYIYCLCSDGLFSCGSHR